MIEEVFREGVLRQTHSHEGSGVSTSYHFEVPHISRHSSPPFPFPTPRDPEGGNWDGLCIPLPPCSQRSWKVGHMACGSIVVASNSWLAGHIGPPFRCSGHRGRVIAVLVQAHMTPDSSNKAWVIWSRSCDPATATDGNNSFCWLLLPLHATAFWPATFGKADEPAVGKVGNESTRRQGVEEGKMCWRGPRRSWERQGRAFYFYFISI